MKATNAQLKIYRYSVLLKRLELIETEAPKPHVWPSASGQLAFVKLRLPQDSACGNHRRHKR